MSILRVFFSIEVVLLLAGIQSDGSGDPADFTKQRDINVLRDAIVSETIQTFIPPEYIKTTYYYPIIKYGGYKEAEQSVRYLLSISRTNFPLNEDEILEQSINICSNEVEFEAVRSLLWAKALNVDAFVTCKHKHFLKFVDHFRDDCDFTEIPIMTISDFLELPDVSRCLREGENRITVHTPMGEPVVLPIGATPVDFAYRIHTEVGNRCRQALVNKLIVPLNTQLANGNVVEIVRDKNVYPDHKWLDFVVTKTARNGIQRWIKNSEMQKGRAVLEAVLGESISEIKGDLLEASKLLSYRTINGLIRALGCNNLQPEEVKKLLGKIKYRKIYEQVLSGSSDEIMMISGDGKSYKFSACCKPSLGESCRGVLGKTHHPIRVHRNDCLSLENLHPTRICSILWDFTNCRVFLEIKMKDKEGVFLSVSDILRRKSISFDIRQIRTYPDKTTAKARIVTTVGSKNELDEIIQLIEPMEIVERIRIVGLMLDC